MKRTSSSKFQLEHRTHERLRIIGGAAAGKRLLSSQGEVTRPMMEKVRGAIFNMVLAQVRGTSSTTKATFVWFMCNMLHDGESARRHLYMVLAQVRPRTQETSQLCRCFVHCRGKPPFSAGFWFPGPCIAMRVRWVCRHCSGCT